MVIGNVKVEKHPRRWFVHPQFTNLNILGTDENTPIYVDWNQLLLKIICVQMCYVAVSKYHTCFIMQKLIPQLSKTWNKQIYALQDLPASLDIGICRPFGTACSSPPSPERAFSRKFERHHEIRIRHFMLFWRLRVEWDTFQFQKACETQKNVFVFLKNSFHSWPFPKLPVVVFSNICDCYFPIYVTAVSLSNWYLGHIPAHAKPWGWK